MVDLASASILGLSRTTIISSWLKAEMVPFSPFNAQSDPQAYLQWRPATWEEYLAYRDEDTLNHDGSFLSGPSFGE
jgi:hypothetical protein